MHIVSFDVPYPPNYGGVIDIYYKIKALYNIGTHVHLHTFEYGRGKQNELDKICDKVTYYKRKTGKINLFNKLPYIVASRRSDELIKNISADNFPVLFEGLHCCYYLNHPALSKKIKLVRTHNIEHDYYNGLASAEKNIFKKIYFLNEAKKLKKFEKQLSSASHILAISESDKQYLSKKYSNVIYVPAFHSNEKINCLRGKGKYALYHGNLSIGENHAAAIFLITEVFSQLPEIKLIITGSNPKKELVETADKYKNIEVKKDISTHEITSLIQEAQINILPTFQPTGLKLKLLTALYNGRHCIVNTFMVENTGMENLCHIANNSTEMQMKVKQLIDLPFETDEIKNREHTLNTMFSTNESAKKIISLLGF